MIFCRIRIQRKRIRIQSKRIRIRSKEGQNMNPVEPDHESNPDAQDANTRIRADALVSIIRYCE